MIYLLKKREMAVCLRCLEVNLTEIYFIHFLNLYILLIIV